MVMRARRPLASTSKIGDALQIGPEAGALSRKVVFTAFRRGQAKLALIESNGLGRYEPRDIVVVAGLPQQALRRILDQEVASGEDKHRYQDAHALGLEVSTLLALNRRIPVVTMGPAKTTSEHGGSSP